MRRTVLRWLAILACYPMVMGATVDAGDVPATPMPDLVAGKPRLLVLSDIGNEPDDQMSLVRLLLYSNEIDIEGLVATTSTWQRDKTNPQTMHAIIADYARVRPNLLQHADGWPSAQKLDAVVFEGQTAYGMAAVGPGHRSAGAKAIVDAVDRPDPRPLWIALWGGANTLAQALSEVRATRTPEQVAAFVAKLRVNAISDQDDAGWWIRREFPKLVYVVTPSTADGDEYRSATWTGISGDEYYRNGDGADFSTVSNAWLETNIRAKGPLGKHYPRYAFIMEGDTPSFLGFTANGLASFRSPSWGGWGGRYVYRQPYGETRPIWTQGGDMFGRVTSQDTVAGADGRQHSSDQATIWRWRGAFQRDFAARMDWTIKRYADANHNPTVVVNGQGGTDPIYLDAKVGAPVTLDATGTRDPDRQSVRYHWFVYDEAGFSKGVTMAALRIDGADGAVATVTPTARTRPGWIALGQPPAGEGVAHVILEVTDTGTPALTSYRRVIFRVR